MSLRVAALASFVLGVVLLMPFEHWWTLAPGVGLLIASVALGLVAIAGPGSALLEGDDDAEDARLPR